MSVFQTIRIWSKKKIYAANLNERKIIVRNYLQNASFSAMPFKWPKSEGIASETKTILQIKLYTNYNMLILQGDAKITS